MTVHLVSFSAFLLLFSSLLGLVFKGERYKKFLKIQNVVAIVLLILALLLRWIFYARAMNEFFLLSFPTVTFYESIVLFVIFALVILDFLCKTGRSDTAVLILSGVIFGTLLQALNFSKIPAEPVLFLPALKSYWLISHVTLSFLAYAMFFVSAVISTIALVKGTTHEKVKITTELVGNGLIIFTIGGLFFGAIWAEQSWGRFWAWDPKETWAFITWCVYAVIAHLAWSRQASEKTLCALIVVAFFFVLFTFAGVNLMFAGLHSYVSLDQIK